MSKYHVIDIHSQIFSEEHLQQQDEVAGTLQTIRLGDKMTDFDIVPNAAIEGVVQMDEKRSRQLERVDFSSQKFFQ